MAHRPSRTRRPPAPRTWAALGVAAALLPALRAAAFDYPEHAHISHHAILLATTDCSSTEACARAHELADALRAHISGELFCAGPSVDEDQPTACFTIGDIPALAGDHAASPLLTMWRWLDPAVPSRKQGGLARALPSVIAILNTSRRSPETELVRAPNRPQFLDYIRTFAPNRWPIPSGPSDAKLEGFDDSYIALAERGHPHFRPRLRTPNVKDASGRVLSTYAQYDPDRVRSKPANNAFAWYADQHLGALRMAHAAFFAPDEDRELLRAVAMFLELNAWHYLEDSVASGHMIADISENNGLNNGALTATHNEYCAGMVPPGQDRPRRVDVKVNRKLCDILDSKKPGWTSALPDLERVCTASQTASASIYGDHMIEKAGTIRKDGPKSDALLPEPNDTGVMKDARFTENWAAALAAESYDEVVRASLGESFGVLPDQDPLADCGRRHTRDPAYTWACGGNEGPFYQCLFAWWEGDQNDEHGEDEHTRDIRLLFDRDAFKALRLVPVPDPPEPDPPQPYAAQEDRYPQETFYSGNSFSVAAFSYAYSSLSSASTATLRAGADVLYLLAAPRTLVPLQVALGGRFESGFEHSPDPRVAAELVGRVYFSTFSKWYAGASGEFGYIFDRRVPNAGADVILPGVTWLDSRHGMSTLELRAGGAGYLGWRGGLNASVAF